MIYIYVNAFLAFKEAAKNVKSQLSQSDPAPWHSYCYREGAVRAPTKARLSSHIIRYHQYLGIKQRIVVFWYMYYMYFYIFHVLHSCYDPSVLLPDQRGFPRSSQEGSPTHSTHSKSAAQTLRWLKHLIIPRCILISEPAKVGRPMGDPPSHFSIQNHWCIEDYWIVSIDYQEFYQQLWILESWESPEETDKRISDWGDHQLLSRQLTASDCQLWKDVECWLCLVLFHHLYICFNVFHVSSIVLSDLLCFKMHKNSIKIG